MPLLDKLFFCKLKSVMGSERTRHRFPIYARDHILSCLASYTCTQRKVNRDFLLSLIQSQLILLPLYKRFPRHKSGCPMG